MSKLFKNVEVDINKDFEDVDVERINNALHEQAEKMSITTFGEPDIFEAINNMVQEKFVEDGKQLLFFYNAAQQMTDARERNALLNSRIQLETHDGVKLSFGADTKPHVVYNRLNRAMLRAK